MSSLRNRKGRTVQPHPHKRNTRTDFKIKDSLNDGKSSVLTDLEQCKQMFSFVISHKFAISAYLLSTLSHVIARISFPIVTGFSITAIISNTDDITISDGIMNFLCRNNLILDCSSKLSLLNTTLYLMIYVNILQSLSNFIRGYYGSLISLRISSEIRNRLFHCILFHDLSFFECNENGKCGVLLSRLSVDCRTFSSFCTSFIANSMDNIFGIIFGICYSLYISYFMTIIMLLCLPISFLLTKYFSKYYKKLTQKLHDLLAFATNIAMESIENIKTVKAFSAESKQELLYAKEIETSYILSTNIAFSSALFEAMINILVFLSIASVLYYGSIMYIEKQINAGNMISFLIISIQVSMFIKRALKKYSYFIKCIASTKRVFQLMNHKINIAPFGGDKPMKPTESIYIYNDPNNINMNKKQISIFGNIEFKNVSFSYPLRANIGVINNISFCVLNGETLGIVGESGNGKSTIINLLMRFYDPLNGEILIDGMNLKHYDLQTLHRNNIGYVEQEPSLFNQTIKWNICYAQSDDDIDINKMIEAAKKAHCYDFIMKLKNRFDTICGERGTQLSGGQKQRIAIARAIYNDPKIIILDEASSALDSENEYLIHQSLQNFIKDKKTIIIIAHRLSTIKSADKIIVLKNGQIVQTGNHKQLFAVKDGEYFKLIQKQLL